jgi:hypothetical protein
MLDQAPRSVTLELRNQPDFGRLWVRLISKRAFRDYLQFRRVSNKQLAEDVTRILRERGYDFRCSESTIAFLRSEKKAARWTCRPETADAIESALNVPPGSLFAVEFLGASPIDNRKPAA